MARGALLWRYKPGESVREHDEASLRAQLKTMTPEAAQDLLEHVYCWLGQVIEILDDAKLWNHSKSPNTGDHPDGEGDGAGDGVSSYALRDIAAGEELVCNYSEFDPEFALLPSMVAAFAAKKAMSNGHIGG